MAWGRLCVGLLIVALASGCPYAIPGLRADLGVAPTTVGGPLRPALHVAGGVSLASLFKTPRPLDAGAGYVLFFPSDLDTVHGGYLDAAWLRRFAWSDNSGFMLSLGVRAELLLQERRDSLHGGAGGVVRVAFERIGFTERDFSEASINESGFGVILGGARGSASIGLSSEVGVRRLPGARLAVFGMVGVTFRLPASAGFILFIPFPR